MIWSPQKQMSLSAICLSAAVVARERIAVVVVGVRPNEYPRPAPQKNKNLHLGVLMLPLPTGVIKETVEELRHEGLVCGGDHERLKA